MTDKQEIFNTYYSREISDIKWFEPFIEPKIITEFNNSQIQAGQTLLDVGAGCSLESLFFVAQGLLVTAIDFAPNALEKLKNISSLFGFKIKTICSSILDIPEEFNSSFDVVSDNGCFHHLAVQDRVAYAHSISRVLKPNGVLYLRAHSALNDISQQSIELRAFRLSSDDIINTFLPWFAIEELSLYDYILTPRGHQKVWFVKLRLRE